jgi:YVTN family beta-propeller protein
LKKTEKTILSSVIIGIFFVALGSYLVTTNVFGEGHDLETGNGPRGLGINSFTNKIYVANYLSDSVSVINGDTNSIEATITLEDRGVF